MFLLLNTEKKLLIVLHNYYLYFLVKPLQTVKIQNITILHENFCYRVIRKFTRSIVKFIIR